MMNTPVLSICIPCFKRLEQVQNTLKSIYEDNSDVEPSLFEVVISDNDPDCELRIVIDEFRDKENLRYLPTKCEGFMNSYYALTYAHGKLLKLINSQTCLLKGCLKELVNQVYMYEHYKPIILSTNDMLGHNDIQEFDNFDAFIYHSSYYSSWSNAFSIWKDDFDQIKDNLKLNNMFPHCSLTMRMSYKNCYIIDDRLLFKMQKIKRKGGHNMFKSFSVDYTGMLHDKYSENVISFNTFNFVKKQLVEKFFPHLFFKNQIIKVDCYDSDKFKENLCIYYSHVDYYRIIVNAWLYPIHYFFILLKRKLLWA